MNILFKTRYIRKRGIYYEKILKAMSMRLPVEIHKRNKKCTVTVQHKNECKLEFVDNLWLPFIDQPQSDILDFAVINFQIYNITV